MDAQREDRSPFASHPGRRRFGAALLALALVASGAGYGSLTLLAPLRPVVAEAVPVVGAAAGAPEVILPDYGASAVGAVGFPGVLAGRNEEAMLPMASITKLVTALVVLEAKPLEPGTPGPAITMHAEDTALWGYYQRQNGNVAPVRSGALLSQRQLLELTLVESANNYATSLARWAFGSDQDFAAAAREWLASHGLDGITVVEPSGIDPANRATAAALVDLGRIALANPTVAEIAGLASIDVPGVGAFENSNRILGKEGVTGLKTGMLDSAGYNLLFSAQYEVGSREVQVVGVVLGAGTRTVLYSDVVELLAGVRDGFREVVVAEPGQAAVRFVTEWGRSAFGETAETATLLVWGDTPIERTTVPRSFHTAGEGDPVGRVTIVAGPERVSLPLYLSADLRDPGPLWRLTNPGQLLAAR